ncbi:MAG: FHA domain-containing protein, partial [Cellulomonas sp.]|jgi:predicted component of type VI protein secretion system|nr:FHA domain-containing protein [Cellulomonas sp.]
VVLGRDPAPQTASDRTVVVRDDASSVSKSHLRVEHTADGVWLTDLGSTNGTRLLVDGPSLPLEPRTRTRIDGVVRVAIGQRVLMVSYMVRGGRP